MHNLFLVFKYFCLLCLVVTGSGCVLACTHQPDGNFSRYKQFALLPLQEESKADTKWAAYLWRQSARRVTDTACVTGTPQSDGQLKVYVHIDASMKGQYAVSQEKDEMYLTASSEENMLWLVYQWIAAMAEKDARWKADDLDPALIGLNDGERAFDFGYRSIYSPSMADPDRQAITANRHVDYHWGLWGHNLRKVFADGEIPEAAQALADGKRTAAQWCFSSTELYEAIVNYVQDAYGDGTKGSSALFAILPNDNRQVCTCELCRKAGNTMGNATPAVTFLLRKLAARFPSHRFYTSAYATTLTPPEVRLPENAGVILSAIDYPLSFAATQGKAYQAWKELFIRWQKVTDRIIVWDYMRNFDDYLTPYPCLSSIQNRLREYKKLGVWGVFFNGSGDDYSTFDDMQTFVLSSLLKNTELDISQCVRNYFQRFYPQSGELLANYYLSLEERIRRDRATLEWYGGIKETMDAYLSVEEFRQFYTALDRLSKNVGEDERQRLNPLLTALNFTQLELIRAGKSTASQAREYLELLKGHTHFPNLSKYKEAHGLLDEYIAEWQQLDFYPSEKGNQFLGKPVSVCLPENKQQTADAAWTDGYQGFPHDYHLHWIISAQKELVLSLPSLQQIPSGELRLSFLHAPAWHIGCPSEVEVFQGGKSIGRWQCPEAPADFTVVQAVLEPHALPAQGEITIKITLGRFKKMACDEIKWYENN